MVIGYIFVLITALIFFIATGKFTFFTDEIIYLKIFTGVLFTVSIVTIIGIVWTIIYTLLDKKRVRNVDIYEYECKIWDKKIEVINNHDRELGKTTLYYVKVADENFVVNEWFLIEGIRYSQIEQDGNRCKIIVYPHGKSSYYKIIAFNSKTKE